MSRLFLSHSSANNREAVALKQWLGKQNPRLANEIFLDLDPGTGIHIGQRWRDALNQAAARCEGVVCLLSTQWESSEWCRWEYSYAAELGKRIFVALLQPGTGAELLDWQQCTLFGDGPKTAIDIGDGEPVLFETEGLYRLREGIRRSGIGSDSFEWPIDDPERAPYRGWRPFEPVDAGIFCGRDAQIVRAMDAVRSMRQAKTKQWFVILGPSGSGKSSFLRAGLIPRMQRDDRQFLVLNIVRPERDVLGGTNGLAAAIYSARKEKDLTEPPLEEIDAACANDSAEVRRLLLELQKAAQSQFLGVGENESLPTIVVPLDQAEELLSPDGARPAEAFLRLMRELVAPSTGERLDVIVAATIRSDRFAGLQTHPELADTETELFGALKPMPSERFEEVITGPAERMTADGRPLEFAPDLLDQLLADCKGGGDTLPLLALTLSRLYEEHGASKTLTLAHYDDIGTLQGVVQTVIDGTLDDDPSTKRGQLDLLRDAFIPWLATVNDDDQWMRRVARWEDLPEASRPLVDAFVANRLLIKDRRDNEDVVEVALESLLWQWDDLATWLNETWRELKAVAELERAAAVWEHNNRHPDWLLAGSRLVDAQALVDTAAFRDRLTETLEYLRASRQAELCEATSTSLVSSAQEMLAHTRAGGDAQACKQLLAAQLLSKQFDEGALQSAAVQLRSTMSIIETGTAHVAFSHDGSILATGGTTVRLWDTRTGQAIGGPLTGCWIDTQLAFSPADSILAIYGPGPMQLWDVGTGRPFDLPFHPACHVAFSADGRYLASGCSDSTVRLWDARTGQPLGGPLKGHSKCVRRVAFSPDGRRLASASEDKTVRLWDVRTGQPLGHPLTAHSETVAGVAFSPDGQRLASASDDKTVRLWSVPTGEPFCDIGHPTKVEDVEFSPDGLYVASTSDDHIVRLWEADTGEPVVDFEHTHTAFSVPVLSPDWEYLASCGPDTVQLWNVRNDRPVGGPLTGHSDGVNEIAFSRDGRRLACASWRDNLAWVWDVGTWVGWPIAVVFSPNGRYFASAGRDDDTVQVWDASSGQPIGALACEQDELACAALSPNGRYLASVGGDDRSLRLWDAQTGQPLGPLTGHSGAAEDIVFSADGRYLATAGGSAVELWDVRAGQAVGSPLSGHDGAVNGVAFSPDGRYLASVSEDQTVRLWDPATGRPIGAPLTGHAGMVECVAFSPDGRYLASGSEDKTVRLWDARTREAFGRPLTGHDRNVVAVAFSPDSRLLASGGWDGEVRLWNVRSCRPFGAPLIAGRDWVHRLAFSVDGRGLASMSSGGRLYLWPVVVSREDLCRKLTVNMSRKQWREWVSPDIPYMKICEELPIPPDEPEET